MIRTIIRAIFRALSVLGYYGSYACRSSFQSGWRAGVWCERTLLRRA